LRELVPKADAIGVLVNPTYPVAELLTCRDVRLKSAFGG
jgi:hypothetical protein